MVFSKFNTSAVTSTELVFQYPWNTNSSGVTDPIGVPQALVYRIFIHSKVKAKLAMMLQKFRT